MTKSLDNRPGDGGRYQAPGHYYRAQNESWKPWAGPTSGTLCIDDPTGYTMTNSTSRCLYLKQIWTLRGQTPVSQTSPV